MEHTIELTEEQQNFMRYALDGKNVLVQACIGSGKTTAIQQLCKQYATDKSILYLTYNKLLKFDARNKIHGQNITVTNYHGYAYDILKRIHVQAGKSDLIQYFLLYAPPIPHYDVLIIDEYQDITQELADELLYIRDKNPGLQIIAVGDPDQKIYDSTTLDASLFIADFLGKHVTLSFSTCFRLPHEYARELGNVWGKKINGINSECTIEYGWDIEQTVAYLSSCQPSEILVLGSNGQYDRARIQNRLETGHRDKFNKHTLWSKITENESDGATHPDDNCAVFTTFDGSKGMERPICVICDFDEAYWETRSSKPQVKYTILRNIFLVAASRGKKKIIFVKSSISPLLTFERLSQPFETSSIYKLPMDISSMFDYKNKEDIEDCYKLVSVEPIATYDTSDINCKVTDGKIDLSPCFGTFLEAGFFKNYDIDEQVKWNRQFFDPYDCFVPYEASQTLQWKLLYLLAYQTRQARYLSQVQCPYITQDVANKMTQRLATVFDGKEKEQVSCELNFSKEENGDCTLRVLGRTDVVKDDVIWELKFVSELQHTYVLQLACYLIALNKQKGVLWNVKDNTMYGVTVPNTQAFLNMVARTITKHQYIKYYAPKASEFSKVTNVKEGYHAMNNHNPSQSLSDFVTKIDNESLSSLHQSTNATSGPFKKCFAVLDTETNDVDDMVISIGMVIADWKTFQIYNEYYGIITPDCNEYSMYGDRLNYTGVTVNRKSLRSQIIDDINKLLTQYHVQNIFAYSASFDCRHLPELSDYQWVDIMRTTMYIQYNPFLSVNAEHYTTGKIYSGYNVEEMIHTLTGQWKPEIHNALCDARDELDIIKSLSLPIEKIIDNDKKTKFDRQNDYAAFSKNTDFMPRKKPATWDSRDIQTFYIDKDRQENEARIQEHQKTLQSYHSDANSNCINYDDDSFATREKRRKFLLSLSSQQLLEVFEKRPHRAIEDTPIKTRKPLLSALNLPEGFAPPSYHIVHQFYIENMTDRLSVVFAVNRYWNDRWIASAKRFAEANGLNW